MVVLNSRIVQSSIPEAQYSTAFNYKWGPSDKDIGNAAYMSATETFKGVGLRPYAPCHVGFAWNGGDLAFTWIRRDRSVAADGWDQTEIPLSETAESYDLEIYDAAGSSVVRTFASLSSAEATYSAAQQEANFPAGLPNPLILKLYQLSTVFGRGVAQIQYLYTR